MAVRRLADAAIQPKSFALTIENLDWAKGEIAKYPEGRQASAILALLWRATGLASRSRSAPMASCRGLRSNAWAPA